MRILIASPSSSITFSEEMRRISNENKNIDFIDGFESIECSIIKGSMRYLITELFTLQASTTGWEEKENYIYRKDNTTRSTKP